MASRNRLPIALVPLPRYGLNDRHSPFEINAAEASWLENIEIGEADAIGRLGCSQYGTTAGSGPIQNMHDHCESDGTTVMLRARQDKIEKLNTTTNAWAEMTLPISYTANKKVSFVTLNDVTIASNGIDSDLKFDGNVWTELSSNPKADVQIIFQNRVVKFKFSNSTVYYSDINDPETYDALSFEPVDPNNAQLGVGIIEHAGQIAVFKEAKTYIMTALIGGSTLPLDGTVGAVSHYSIVSTGSSTIFLSASGWHEIRGSVIYPISDHLDMEKLTATDLSKAHAVFFNNVYRCWVAERGSAYNNLEYCFNLNIRTPFPFHPYAVTVNRGRNGLCYLKTNHSGQEKLYFGDSRPDSGSPSVTHSKVYLMFNGYSDDGVEIAAGWDTKLFDSGMPFYSKRYKRAYIRVENQSGLTYYFAHRFGADDAWNEQALVFTSVDLPWVMDDGSEITTWLEGYSWPFEGATDDFVSLTNTGRPRTIMFRNRVSSATARARWIYEAYQYRTRDKFK